VYSECIECSECIVSVVSVVTVVSIAVVYLANKSRCIFGQPVNGQDDQALGGAEQVAEGRVKPTE
jgi:hypothetical protein